MPKRIHKYKVPESRGRFYMVLPAYARIISVQIQRSIPVMWAVIDIEAPNEYRSFILVETGENLPDEIYTNSYYLGTLQLQDGDYVLHLFEVRERPSNLLSNKE
jgi:hypothetical protein